MSRRELAESRILITGASSGIGRELAAELARHGACLVLLARREERLRSLAEELAAHGERPEIICGDVTSAEVRLRAIERARERFGGLDILVNNAGVGAIGRFEHASEDRLRRIMDVNFFAAAEMIRAALPLLRRGNRPLVVNVGSVLGHRAIPRTAEYCASKFALQGLSESLRAEFAELGIGLLVVSPGTTETEFFDSVLERKGEHPRGGRKGTSAALVVRRTVRAMQTGRHEIIPSFSGKLLCWANRLSPALVDRLMARYA